MRVDIGSEWKRERETVATQRKKWQAPLSIDCWFSVAIQSTTVLTNNLNYWTILGHCCFGYTLINWHAFNYLMAFPLILHITFFYISYVKVKQKKIPTFTEQSTTLGTKCKCVRTYIQMYIRMYVSFTLVPLTTSNYLLYFN